MREGDQVWIMNREGLLEIRPVTIAYRGADRVVITEGIEAGEHIVKSDIAAAAFGMPLRVDEPARSSGDTTASSVADGQGTQP